MSRLLLLFVLFFLRISECNSQVQSMLSPEELHDLLMKRAHDNYRGGTALLFTSAGVATIGGVILLTDMISNTDGKGSPGWYLTGGGIAGMLVSVHLFNVGNYNKRMAEFALQRKTSWHGNKSVSYPSLAIKMKF